MLIPRHLLRARIRLIFIHACLAALPSEVTARGPDDNVIETFDVARNGYLLLVPVMFDDRTFQFVVDTGASFSVVDSAIDSYLQRVDGSAQVNGIRYEKRYYIRGASVGESRLPVAGKAISLDLARFREASGHNIRGFLGMDFLKAHVICVDFDAGKLSILKAVPASAGTEFRLFANKFEVPLVDIEIADGDVVGFGLDTGMVGSALEFTSSRFDELMEAGRLELVTAEVQATNADGILRRVRGGLLGRFRLGDFTHERIKVTEGQRNQIGLGLLSRYVATFDFPKARLYLKPGKRFGEPEMFGSSPLILARACGKTRIQEIEKCSSADKAGLTAGDELLQFDGRDASALGLFEMHSALRTGGRRIRLEVTGPADRREVEIIVPHHDLIRPNSSMQGSTQK